MDFEFIREHVKPLYCENNGRPATNPVLLFKYVEQAIDQGLMGGKALFTDSTHLKANANKCRHQTHEVGISPMDYLGHRTVDEKYNFITDTYVTPDNINDSRPYLQRLDRQCQRFGFAPTTIGLDAGYNTAPICHGLKARAIDGVIGYKRPHTKAGFIYKRQYEYDEAN